jgi:hypothetical protein
MSVPLPIDVVVLASSEAGLHWARKVSGLKKPGVSPRYLMATIERSDKFPSFSSIDPAGIGFWIALDQPSKLKCQETVARLQSDTQYSRGFYDVHLPDPVVIATDMADLQRIVDDVWEAFCATS